MVFFVLARKSDYRQEISRSIPRYRIDRHRKFRIDPAACFPLPWTSRQLLTPNDSEASADQTVLLLGKYTGYAVVVVYAVVAVVAAVVLVDTVVAAADTDNTDYYKEGCCAS